MGRKYGSHDSFQGSFVWESDNPLRVVLFGTRLTVATFQAQPYALSEAEKAEEVSSVKEYILSYEEVMNKDINIQENINGSTATLIASYGGDESFELITLVLEGNQWKAELDDFR